MKEIKLGKSGEVARVSDEDFERLSKFNWTLKRKNSGTKYAIRNPRVGGRRVWVQMHREVMGLGPGEIGSSVVDHRDGNGLNNQRENLEVVAYGENIARANRKRKKPPVEPFL